MVSGGVSQATSDSPRRGDSDSTLTSTQTTTISGYFCIQSEPQQGRFTCLMAPLQCLTFNCRGWTSGKQTLHTLIGSLDLCFIQEHWLLHDQLYVLNEFHPDFHSISVSGVDSSVLLHGQPYGGCAILYRKSICSSITPLVCDSD